MRTTVYSVMALLLLIADGCSGPKDRAEVSGMVRLNGQPLATGSIAFVPTEGNQGPSSGGVITDGAYRVSQVKGVAVGKNRVMISSTINVSQKNGGAPGSQGRRWTQLIPPKYNNQSELTCTIKPGSNKLDYDLQSPPTQR